MQGVWKKILLVHHPFELCISNIFQPNIFIQFWPSVPPSYRTSLWSASCTSGRALLSVDLRLRSCEGIHRRPSDVAHRALEHRSSWPKTFRTISVWVFHGRASHHHSLIAIVLSVSSQLWQCCKIERKRANNTHILISSR